MVNREHGGHSVCLWSRTSLSPSSVGPPAGCWPSALVKGRCTTLCEAPQHPNSYHLEHPTPGTWRPVRVKEPTKEM